MKVTYLLGAGASYKAVPIIGELNDAFLEINQLCNGNRAVNARKDLIKPKSLFDSHMKTGASAAKLFGTVDTYAKKLSLTHNHDLVQFKAALSLFFTIWQEVDKKHLAGRISKDLKNGNISYLDVDDRYMSLLANYLYKKNTEVLLSEDVNFITWNYDTQLERAISLFIDKSLETILKHFTVYPYYSENKPKILHLNGIAGLYKDFEDENKMKTLFKDGRYKNPSELFETILHFMEKSENKVNKNDEYFTYAWETDDISLKAVKYAEEMLKETNVLVIIGYSFPTFNDSVDKKLFKCLNESPNFNMVYYQDPNASVELLNARFGIDEKKIKIVKEVDQFILPLDSYSFSKNEPKKRINARAYGLRESNNKY